MDRGRRMPLRPASTHATARRFRRCDAHLLRTSTRPRHNAHVLDLAKHATFVHVSFHALRGPRFIRRRACASTTMSEKKLCATCHEASYETTAKAMDVAMAKAATWTSRRNTRIQASSKDLRSGMEKFRAPGHTPRDVVQVQLRSLQAGDEEAFLSLCSQLSCGLHQVETWDEHEALERKKNFGRCGSVLDEAGRRMLPYHFSYEELSALHTTPTKYQQRTRVVSTTGEKGVFAWYLHSHAGYWMVDAVRLVEVETGSGSGSPEEVLRRQLLDLKRGDIRGAYRYNNPGEDIDISNVSRAGKSTFSAHSSESGEAWEKFGALLRSPAYQLLLGHESAQIISTCSLASDLFKMDVLIRGKWMGSVPFCEAHYESALFSWTFQLQDTLGWRVKKIRRIANIPMGR